jgi:hypothetical protein
MTPKLDGKRQNAFDPVSLNDNIVILKSSHPNATFAMRCDLTIILLDK